MSYLRHMEYSKNETDMHPQTGETKPKTTIDVYVYPDQVWVMGWGWSHTFRPGPKTVDEIVATVQDLFKVEGFQKMWEDGPAPVAWTELDGAENGPQPQDPAQEPDEEWEP